MEWFKYILVAFFSSRHCEKNMTIGMFLKPSPWKREMASFSSPFTSIILNTSTTSISWKLGVQRIRNDGIKLTIIALLVIQYGILIAQDPQFSQFYAAPSYLNPAFTGNTIQGRFAGIYRKQWPKIPGAFTSQAFSYDHNFVEKNSGLGLVAITDKAGSAALKYTSLGLAYAYNINISRYIATKFGLRASRIWRNIDAGNLIFADQLIQNQSSSRQTINIQENNYWDFATGWVIYGRTFWFGAATDHINRPNQSLIGGDVKLPIKYTIHGGMTFDVTKNSKGKSTSTYTITSIYKGQQNWDQLDIGWYFHVKPVIIGMWYRGLPIKVNPGKDAVVRRINQDALTFMLGLKYENYLHIGYSYDATISKLAGSSGGAHEIAIIYEYSTKKKKLTHRRRFLIPCAKF